MSKTLFVDGSGYIRGYIEKHDGIETPDFDERYGAIMSSCPGSHYAYNVNTGAWVYEPPEIDPDPELTAEEALAIITGGDGA